MREKSANSKAVKYLFKALFILAVAHESFKELTMDDINSLYSGKNTKVLTDLKGILDKKAYQDAGYIYWRL